MNAARFDHIARALAARRSRRQVMLGLGGAALAGGAWSGPAGFPFVSRAASNRLATRSGPDILPASVSRQPIPLGGNRFLMNGRAVAVDLDVLAAAFGNGAASVPFVVDEATYHLDAATVARGARLHAWKNQPDPVATPMVTPAEGRNGPLPGETLEAVCGGDQTQDVEQYRGDLGVSKEFVSGHQPMVGNLRWKGNLATRYTKPGNVNGVRWCSGTLIAKNLFLTASHCLFPFPPDPDWEVPRIEGTTKPIPSTEIATNMKVEFDYQLDANGNDRQPQKFDVVKLVENVFSIDVDYAILQLDGEPGKTYGVSRIGEQDPPIGSRICIIGHPQGQAKRVAAGIASDYLNGKLRYFNIDTDKGASGSGILSSPEGPLVGVHVAGECIDQDIGDNRGIPISALLTVSATLRGIAGVT